MSSHKMSPHKFHTTQLIFVKNVPQESASSVASLYTQYKPLEVKNLYSASRITTLMIALPTADVAASALHRTDGMRVDSTVISVERYNAKQSTAARRETRRKRNGGSAETHDEEYEADGWEEVDELLESWDDEDDTYVADEPVVVKRTTSKSEGVSWADVTRGKGVAPDTPSSSSATPGVNTPRSPVMTPDSPASIRGDASRQDTPYIMFTPASLTPTSLVELRQSSLLRTYSIEESHIAPPPTESSESEQIDEDSSQATQIPNFAQQQRGSLAWSTDTTAYIRNRHCTGCAFCTMQFQGR